jgi:hypothetical protein
MLAWIKYQVGFYPMTSVPDAYKGQPVQYYFWTSEQRRWIEPIEWLICFCWTLEMCVLFLPLFPQKLNSRTSRSVCHWEECFYWLFLLRLKPSSKGWFQSLGFRSTIASAIFVPALFIVLNSYYIYSYTSTDLINSNVFTTEAVIAMAFSLSILVQNGVFSFYIIPRFPRVRSFLFSLSWFMYTDGSCLRSFSPNWNRKAQRPTSFAASQPSMSSIAPGSWRAGSLVFLSLFSPPTTSSGAARSTKFRGRWIS